MCKSYGDTVDERRADDITVFIIREAKPEGLFRYFEDHGIEVECFCSGGIYHIQEYPLRKVMALEKELVPI